MAVSIIQTNKKWKYIKGYEGLYQINEQGQVISLPRNGTIKEIRYLKQFIDKYGYKYVSLNKNNIKKKYKVHRLVARAFIPNPNNYLQINHKDGNKQNNTVNNLEWCTNSYNQRHALKNGLRKTKKVILSKGQRIWLFDSIVEASKELKIDASSIVKCCKGKRKKVKGYMVEYDE